jgi:hypothetical protein
MKNRILSLLLILYLISCKKAEIPVNKFVRVWYDTQRIVPGKSSIKINKDSTFRYENAGCDWNVISKGKWKIIGDSIELNSTSIDTCYKMFPFIECIRFGKYDRKDTLTILNCEPVSDKSFAILNREKFYIKNDSLIYKLNRSSNCPDTLKIVFAKTQKLKK